MGDLSLSLSYSGVTISIYPDLHVREAGMERIIKLEFGSRPPDDVVIRIMSQAMFEAASAAGLNLRSADILLVDVPLFQLGRHLREYGVSIVGPGARPYKRNRQFAPIAEQVCGYIMEPRPEAIAAIERTLFNTILDVTGRASFDIFSYAGRVTVFRLLHEALELHGAHAGAIAWLEAGANSFAAVLIDDEYLSRAEKHVFAMSVEEMKADMNNNGADLANLIIDDLGIYASPDAALKLSNLHNAKGREYQAVAMTDLYEGRIPHYQSQTAEEFAEAKRLF